MSKTLKYYTSKDKQVKPAIKIGAPRYQLGGYKNSDSYKKGKCK